MVWNSPWCPICLGDPTTNTEHHPKVRISEFGEFLHAGTHQSECRYWLEAWKPVCRAVFLDVELASTRYVFQGKSQLGNTGFYTMWVLSSNIQAIFDETNSGTQGGAEILMGCERDSTSPKDWDLPFFGGYYDWDGTSSKDFSTACCSIAAHFKNQLIRFLAGKTVTYSSIFSWFFIQFLMFWLVKWICQCIFLWFVHWNLVFLTVFWTEGATTVATPQVLREIQELQWRWICNGWVPKTWVIHTWNTYIYI